MIKDYKLASKQSYKSIRSTWSLWIMGVGTDRHAKKATYCEIREAQRRRKLLSQCLPGGTK